MSIAARLIRDRADSYGEDARRLADGGMRMEAIAYRTIRDELRKVAKAIEDADPAPAAS